MKIIIVGCGKIGVSIIKQLIIEKHDITVIDQNTDVINDITNNYDVMGFVGNGASYSVQKEAGVDKADLLIGAFILCIDNEERFFFSFALCWLMLLVCI